MSKELSELGFFNAFDKLFENVFENTFSDFPIPYKSKRCSNMEIAESEKDINVSLELPGINIEDIDISVDSRNCLTIKGEKKSENTDKKDGKVIKTERYYGSFERTVGLGSNVDPNGIDATYKKGILKLIIPKIGEEETIKIKVK